MLWVHLSFSNVRESQIHVHETRRAMLHICQTILQSILSFCFIWAPGHCTSWKCTLTMELPHWSVHIHFLKFILIHIKADWPQKNWSLIHLNKRVTIMLCSPSSVIKGGKEYHREWGCWDMQVPHTLYRKVSIIWK